MDFSCTQLSVPIKENSHIIMATQQPAATWVEVSVADLHSSASWEHYMLSRVSGLTSSIPLPWFPVKVPRWYDFRAIAFSRLAGDSATLSPETVLVRCSALLFANKGLMPFTCGCSSENGSNRTANVSSLIPSSSPLGLLSPCSPFLLPPKCARYPLSNLLRLAVDISKISP